MATLKNSDRICPKHHVEIQPDSMCGMCGAGAPPVKTQAALQPWVMGLTIMQQSVLISAVRGPDGLRKDHPVKVFMRWYRRCVLLSAFDRRALYDPLESGGGSFTGPLPLAYVSQKYSETGMIDKMMINSALDEATDKLFRSIDEMPHHFWLHILHAAQILGFKHPIAWIRDFWLHVYQTGCADMHMYGESEEEMDDRLGDSESQWRAREATPAK